MGVNIVITTPKGVVFLFPPGEPSDAPAALPGGCVEFGETPEEAAIQEAREETGLDVEIVREIGRQWSPDSPLGPMLSFMYEARAIGGALQASHEGEVEVHPSASFPTISPKRRGIKAALAAYLHDPARK